MSPGCPRLPAARAKASTARSASGSWHVVMRAARKESLSSGMLSPPSSHCARALLACRVLFCRLLMVLRPSVFLLQAPGRALDGAPRTDRVARAGDRRGRIGLLGSGRLDWVAAWIGSLAWIVPHGSGQAASDRACVGSCRTGQVAWIGSLASYRTRIVPHGPRTVAHGSGQASVGPGLRRTDRTDRGTRIELHG